MLKIFKSLFVIVVVAAMATSATGAYFSNTVTSSGNSFASGTMTININGETPTATGVFNESDLAPDQVIGQRVFTVNNTGTLNGHHIDLTINLDAGNGSDLANNIVFTRPDGYNSFRFGSTTGATDSINIINYLYGGFNDNEYDLYDGDTGASLFGVLAGDNKITLQDLADLGKIRIVPQNDFDGINAGTTSNLYMNAFVSPDLTAQGEVVNATFTWTLEQDASQM